MKYLFALLLAVLAGCEALPFPGQERDEAPAQDAQVPPAPEAVEDQPQPADREAAATVQEARIPPPPAEKPELPSVDDEQLLGLTPEAVRALLGEPAGRREQSPATVWAYGGGDCRLELYFYYDLETQRRRTLAYDVYAGDGSDAARRLCLRRLKRERAGGEDDGS